MTLVCETLNVYVCGVCVRACVHDVCTCGCCCHYLCPRSPETVMVNFHGSACVHIIHNHTICTQ